MHACRNHRFIAAVERCENGGLEQGKEKAESRRRKGAQIQSQVLKLPTTAAVAINSRRLESLTAGRHSDSLISLVSAPSVPLGIFRHFSGFCSCAANILGDPNLLDNHDYIATSFSFFLPLASQPTLISETYQRSHITSPTNSPPLVPFFSFFDMFFKRRSRANSYVDADSPPHSQSYEKYDARPESSRNPTAQHNTQPSSSSPTEKNMYPRQQAPQESYTPRGMSNGGGHNAMPVMEPAPLSTNKTEPMPDLLAQAFNQAVRPYTEKIEQLESQLADMQSWVEQLEQQRSEVYSWIDKRGLRPGE